MENQTKKYIEQLKEDPRINKTEGSDPPVKLVESVYLLDKNHLEPQNNSYCVRRSS